MRTKWSKSYGRAVCPCCGASFGVHLINNISNYGEAIPSTPPSIRGSGYSPSKGGITGGEKTQTKEVEFLYMFPEEFTEDIDFCKVWGDFEQFRKDKKKKLTRLGVKRMVNKLQIKQVREVVRMIDRSIENSWTGIFDLDSKDQDTDEEFTSDDNKTFYGIEK